jgi:hypothetical protein
MYRSTIKRGFHLIPGEKKIEDLNIKLANDGFLYRELNVNQTPIPHTRHNLKGWVKVKDEEFISKHFEDMINYS